MGDHNIYSEEDVLKGAFIKAWKVIKRGTELQSFHTLIKLTEIKSILTANKDTWSVFYTYKDCQYATNLQEDELLKAINTFIFQQEEYFEAYGW